MLKGLISNQLVLAALIFIGYIIVSNIIKKAIDRLFGGIKKRISHERMLAKTKTIRGFLKNIVDAVLLFIALLMILSQFGVNITPILTGAGVLGLAISFGSQTLIKDLISGFFILIEDQFNVGDYVKIGNFKGEVYKLTMRLTVLKDKEGNLIYIPNSQIV
ncbi:MAG: mechanosensitive ion channel family protein, partial [Microgenomates group bacterium]